MSSELGPSRIQVCVRKRPLSNAEINGNEEDVVTVTGNNTIELTVPKLAVDLTKYTQKVMCFEGPVSRMLIKSKCHISIVLD